MKSVRLEGFGYERGPQGTPGTPGLFKELLSILKLESFHVKTILQFPYHFSTSTASTYVTSAVLYARAVSYSSLINVTSGADIILNFAQHLGTLRSHSICLVKEPQETSMSRAEKEPGTDTTLQL